MADQFWELYRDPRWQAMRLRVMEREGFACEWCGATDKTLNVHHTYYTKGESPWEYPPETLRCLCESCHVEAEDQIRGLRFLIGGLKVFQIEQVIGYAYTFANLHKNTISLSHPSHFTGCADFFKVSVQDVFDCSSSDYETNPTWKADIPKLIAMSKALKEARKNLVNKETSPQLNSFSTIGLTRDMVP